MIFDEWFHKEYEPADLQIKQYAERKEGLHIPATVYLEDLKKAFEAGQKDKEAQIEEMKSDVEANIRWADENKNNLMYFKLNTMLNQWEIKEK
jgi:hypothetical protein